MVAFLFAYIALQVPHWSNRRTSENGKEVGSVNSAGLGVAVFVAVAQTLAGLLINVGSAALG